MDFTYYREESVWLAVALINTRHAVTGADEIPDVSSLAAFLARHDVHDRVTQSDLGLVHELRGELRAIFIAPDETSAVKQLNRLLEKYNALPCVVRDDVLGLHLHFERARSGTGRWIAALTVMGLAFVLCDYGAERMGVCAASSCRKAFIDTSKNRSKRYCSEACAHRQSVAAYRARRRQPVAVQPAG